MKNAGVLKSRCMIPDQKTIRGQCFHLVAHQTGSTRKVLAVVLDSFSLLVLPAFQPLKVSLSVVRFRHPLPHCPHLLLHRTVPNLDLAGKTQHDADSSDAS